MADRIRLGNAALIRVVESGVDGLPRELFVQTPVEAWNELADEFGPAYWSQGGWRIVWEDSVFPVKDQIELWSDDNQVGESLRLRPAPGHTPGSSVLWLDAGKPAVFVGDLTHCPIQLHRPTDPCAFDEDFEAAAVTRKRVLTEASRRRASVIPAHYPGHGGATVVARGDAFMVDDWLALPEI